MLQNSQVWLVVIWSADFESKLMPRSGSYAALPVLGFGALGPGHISGELEHYLVAQKRFEMTYWKPVKAIPRAAEAYGRMLKMSEFKILTDTELERLVEHFDLYFLQPSVYISQ